MQSFPVLLACYCYAMLLLACLLLLLELSKRGTKNPPSASGACFRSLLLSHHTKSGQQRSYVARSVAMQSECNLTAVTVAQ
jgi:hypothetical protein